jgi:hypothetical protein
MRKFDHRNYLGNSLIAIVVMLIVLPPVQAEIKLTPHTAEYKIKISVLGGRLTTKFTSTGDEFTAESLIEATGLASVIARGEIREQSWFSQTSDGIRPSRYLSSDSLSKGGTDVDLVFDWDEHAISGVIGGEDFLAEINGVLHDRVSLQYALMYDLLKGDYSDEYSLQDAEELKLLSVTALGTKDVKVPFGKFEAVGLQHRAGTSSRVTTLWFAKELDFLPVLIEQHRKGKLQVRAVLTEYVPLDDGTTGASAQ